MTDELRRGDVVLVRFDPAEGREIRKTRPAVVVSNDVACRLDAVVQIVPVTSLPDRSLRPYESRIDQRMSGLDKPSRAVANQLRTVARHRIITCLGRLGTDELEALDRAVMIQLALRREP
jgi:mRNA interferase MazF